MTTFNRGGGRQQLLELRRIENNRALIDKWNGQVPMVQSGQGGGMLLQLPKPQ